MFISFMRTLSFRIYKSLLTHHIGEPTKSYKNLQVRHKKFENFSFLFIDTFSLKRDKIYLISNQIVSYNQKDIYLQQTKMKRSG